MNTRQSIINYLQEISEEASFIEFDFVHTERYSLKLKCRVEPDQPDYNQYVADWVKKFSVFSATTWIVRNSYPNMKRLAYRKVYACQRSAFNKKIKQTADLSRNQGCRAKIDFRVKFINKNTIKNDPLLKNGLNMTITMEFIHSHKLRTPEAFNLLKSTSETDAIFYSYLTSGYSPTTAKLYHELTLIDRYGHNPEYMINANINPTPRHVHYLHGKFQKSISEKQSFEDILAAKKTSLENAGGFINYDNPEVITILTATMTRVISSCNLDHILIDSAPVNGSVITMFHVPSKAGALPVACVLHAEQNETNYTQAFLALKLALDNKCNGFEPKLLTVKECKEIRAAANAIFPSCNVFTSKWSLCSQIWQWIHRDDTKSANKKNHSLMELFSKLIKANCLKESEIYYNELKNEDFVKSSAVVSLFVDELWDKRDQWSCADEHSYMKLVEVSIRLMDEFVHRKCKSFNMYGMIDVVTNIIESQIRHILHAHANNASIAATYTRFLVTTNPIPDIDRDLKRSGPNEFRLHNQSKPKRYIRFRVDTWCCDCAVGRKGRFCEHLCSIINTVSNELIRPCELTDEEKCMLEKIAGANVESKLIKSEVVDRSKMSIEEYYNVEMENEYRDEEIDNDDIDHSATSPKSEGDVDNFYYLDVKAENREGIDPLEALSISENEETNEEFRNTAMGFDINTPSTSKVTTTESDLRRKYEDAMKGLNDEFRRLNKYFKHNPNKGNMETMLRLARELRKIRPIERVDLSNMSLTMNRSKCATDD